MIKWAIIAAVILVIWWKFFKGGSTDDLKELLAAQQATQQAANGQKPTARQTAKQMGATSAIVPLAPIMPFVIGWDYLKSKL